MQNVLDSLIPALLADENRRFIYVEQVVVCWFCSVFVCVCVDWLSLEFGSDVDGYEFW